MLYPVYIKYKQKMIIYEVLKLNIYIDDYTASLMSCEIALHISYLVLCPHWRGRIVVGNI